MEKKTIELPENVKIVLEALHNSGFSVYVVGGAIRSLLLRKEPNDWDVATSALPEEVIEVFSGYEVIPTGLQHGTVSVIVHNQPIEVTTFRVEDGYSDNRHPDRITFARDIEDDLMRRDFCMNAIAYNPWRGLVDPYNGRLDIENKTIRCMGNPYNRFNEDGLRILRALRFAAQLGFKIEEKTSKAIHDCKYLLNNISKERIQSELSKILISQYCGKHVLYEYSDVICQIIPEIEPMLEFEHNDCRYKNENLWKHIMWCIGSYYREDKNGIIVRLALLLHDIGKPHCYTVNEDGIKNFDGHADVSAKMAYKILRDLKFSNEIVAYTTQLISYHCFDFDSKDCHPKIAVKRLLNKIGEMQLRRLIALQKCELAGQSLYLTDKRKLDFVLMAEYYLDEILANDECYSLKQLAVNGDDLIESGIAQGKEIGVELNKLLDVVVRGYIENDKEALLKFSKGLRIMKKIRGVSE